MAETTKPTNTIYQPTPDSATKFVISLKDQEVSVVNGSEQFKEFVGLEFQSTKLIGDCNVWHGVIFKCQHFNICMCENTKCEHKKVSEYPYNALATKILTSLYTKKTMGYYGEVIWVSGDCYLEVKGCGRITPSQLKLLTVGGPKTATTCEIKTQTIDKKPKTDASGTEKKTDASDEKPKTETSSTEKTTSGRHIVFDPNPC